MQTRYLGDERDYILYALLHHVSGALDARIGMNWYRTNPQELGEAHNNDGNKRDYLNDRRKGALAPELFDLMRELQGDERSLDLVEKYEILPHGTLYFDGCYRKDGANGFAREKHHRQSLDALRGTGLVFLNPDNGFQVKSVPTKRHKKAPKYIFYDEFNDYLAMGLPIITVQFQGRMSVEARLAGHMAGIKQRPLIIQCPSGMLFFCFAPDSACTAAMRGALAAFAEKGRQAYSGSKWAVL